MFTLVPLTDGEVSVHVEPIFLTIYGVKVVGATLTLILLVHWIRIFLLIHICHPNASWIFVSILFSNIPPKILQFFMVLEEAGLIDVQYTQTDLIFMFFDFARLWTVYFTVHANLTIAVERLFSIIYLNDYERRVRPQIFFVLLTMNSLVSTACTVYMIYEVGSMATIIVWILLTNSIAMALYWYVLGTTNRQHEQLFRRSIICVYSLSERYQIIENFRIIKLCKSLYLSATFMNLIGLAIFVVPYLRSYDQWHYDLWKHIFLAFLNCYAIPVLLCPLIADKEWIRIFKNVLPCFEERQAPLPHEINPKKGLAESNEYFKMLHLQWR